jgi:hypothetical protein
MRKRNCSHIPQDTKGLSNYLAIFSPFCSKKAYDKHAHPQLRVIISFLKRSLSMKRLLLLSLTILHIDVHSPRGSAFPANKRKF